MVVFYCRTHVMDVQRPPRVQSIHTLLWFCFEGQEMEANVDPRHIQG